MRKIDESWQVVTKWYLNEVRSFSYIIGRGGLGETALQDVLYGVNGRKADIGNNIAIASPPLPQRKRKHYCFPRLNKLRVFV